MSRTIDWGGTPEKSEKYEEKTGRPQRAEREERSQHADIIQGNPGLRLHGPACRGPTDDSQQETIHSELGYHSSLRLRSEQKGRQRQGLSIHNKST